MAYARSVSLRLSLALLSLLLTTAVFAKNDRLEPIAKMNPSASAISWQPTVDSERIVLIIGAPDGTTYSREFVSGNAPVFRLADLPAKSGDGVYQFELRAIPRVSAEVKRQLADARAKNDDAAIQRVQHANGLDRNQAQSGVLTVVNGAFINSDADEPAGHGGSASIMRANSGAEAEGSEKDGNASAMYRARVTPMTLVTAQDEVIQGSLCVGLDCTSTESFGFDTVRLKENNTRIKFDDTSASTGFPNNDWQLTANDSASGGANKFSIDDVTNSKTPFTITAAAPTNSLFVASSGKIGFGNNNPGLNLHITATDTPAIRQEQSNGGGFTAQTWDIGANEANWFVRDVTGGSRLPLRIRPGAPTSSVDIAASGNVGIGTASPFAKLNVTGGSAFVQGDTGALGASAGAGIAVKYSSNGAEVFGYDYSTNQSKNLLLQAPGGNVGIGGATSPTQPIQHLNGAYLSSGGVWTNASSRDLKTDICDLDDRSAVNTLRELNPVTYVYKADLNEHHVGFIAEDVPALVATKDRRSLSPMDIVAVLTKVVQDQQTTIDQLKTRLDQIEKGQKQ
jgi:hypothetical protein